jgi:hypothetical protein
LNPALHRPHLPSCRRHKRIDPRQSPNNSDHPHARFTDARGLVLTERLLDAAGRDPAIFEKAILATRQDQDLARLARRGRRAAAP